MPLRLLRRGKRRNTQPPEPKWAGITFIGLGRLPICVAFIMTPGQMYLSLVTGIGIGEAAQWVTVILFLEIRQAFVHDAAPAGDLPAHLRGLAADRARGEGDLPAADLAPAFRRLPGGRALRAAGETRQPEVHGV